MGEPSPAPRKRGRPRKDKSREDREKEETPTEKMRDRVDKKPQQAPVDEKFNQWKTLVPLLYDWLASHSLLWPSLSCRWGPQYEQGNLTNRQRLYLSEQTDGTAPNTLVIANCEVVKARVAATEHIAQFNEAARSTFVKKYKTILHPGEVNRIRELPQNTNIVATHTDCPEVLIWDVESQPDRSAVLGAGDSRPDLVLTGHQENAEFALAMCPVEPLVLSGDQDKFHFYPDRLKVLLREMRVALEQEVNHYRARKAQPGKDKSVVLWSIQDHVSTLGLEQTVGTAGSITKASDNSSLGPRGIFQGHEDTVEDVQFCPLSAQEFCSVGDDSCLILWDARAGFSPAVKVNKAHDADIHCVDWNPHDANLILTGSADHSVRLFDRRKLTSDEVGSPIQKFEGHSAAVLCVQWSPHVSSVFGSSAEDAFLNIWDYAKVDKQKSWETMKHSPPGLFFRHAGHRDKVVDFHWNAADPWTIVSVSDDADTSGGGGTLQIWRMSDLIYRPEEEVLSEIEKFKAHVSACNSKS